ncbi:MAG: flagellar basal body P-ring formation chaperone FlgA [Pseudorhodobacter sp.]
MIALVLLLALMPLPALAESLVATRTIRAQSVLEVQDMALVAAVIPGAITRTEEAVGLEARVTLYAGRAIRRDDLGPPTLVQRNQIVTLVFRLGALDITTDGRALERGGRDDRIRVMNLGSRATIIGRVAADGSVHVGPQMKAP